MKTPMSRTCRACGESKLIREFPFAFGRKDGRSLTCRACRRTKPKATPVPGLRRCSACARVLPASDFNRNRARPGGLHTECKRCQRAIVRHSARRACSVCDDPVVHKHARWCKHHQPRFEVAA